jgi:predicted alpha/beta-fold hydrolase
MNFMRSAAIANGTFHPIRWTLLFAVGVPFLLLALSTILHVGGNDGLLQASLRTLRWITTAELVLLVAVATAGAVYEFQSRARDRRDYPAPGQLIDLGGYRLHVQCAGPEQAPGVPTVVLDSGLAGSVVDWRRVFPEVTRFARVCAYDRGGYGWSEASPRPHTPEGITADLHALLEKSGKRSPYILVGHSLGGLNMWAYASRYPDEVAGLVLVDSAHPQQSFPFPWQERIWL